MADYVSNKLDELYKESRVMKDDSYLMNLDYLTQFVAKPPRKVRMWTNIGKVPLYEVIEVTKDSQECKMLLEDANKCITIKIVSNKLTTKTWLGFIDVIKSTLNTYADENGRVCIRKISRDSPIVGSMKMLSITVHYGHYMYELADE